MSSVFFYRHFEVSMLKKTTSGKLVVGKSIGKRKKGKEILVLKSFSPMMLDLKFF